MANRDQSRTSLPTVRPSDRPRVSGRETTKASAVKFGTLSSTFFRKSEERDPAMGIRGMLVEKDRAKSLGLSRANVSSINNSVALAQEQNDLLRQIIDAIKLTKAPGGGPPPPAGGGAGDLGDLIDRDRVRPGAKRGTKPGRGRFGSAARKRLERMRAAKAARPQIKPGYSYNEKTKRYRDTRTGKFVKPSEALTTKPGDKAAARSTAKPATKPRVEPRVQTPTPQQPAAQPRPSADVRAEGPRAPTSDRRAIKGRIEPAIRNRIGQRVLSKIPAAGLVFGLFYGAQRAMAGDYVGAGLEVASGAAGALSFGFGTAVSLGLDATILARDVYSEAYGINIEEDPLRDERMSELSSVIGEVVRDMITSRPEPRIPEYNSETRDSLLQLYRMAQEDGGLRAAIGEDVIAGLVPLLRRDPSRLGRQGDAVRSGIDTALRNIQTRLLRSGRLVTPVAADDELLNRTSASALEAIAETEYDEIRVEGDIIEFEGRINLPSSAASTNLATPTATRMPSASASGGGGGAQIAPASPMSVPSAVPSRPTPSAGGGTTDGAAAAGGESGDFMSEVNRVSSRFGVNPSDMLALMRSESSLNPQAVNPTTGATGLIQFMPGTARSLGTTTEALRQMSAAEQMKYVEKFFESVRLPQGASAGQLYAYVFLPGRARRDVLTVSGEAFYDANRGLDMDSDGRITIADLDARMARFGGTTQVSMVPSGGQGGAQLASASGGMAAADQAQARGTDRQVIVEQGGQQQASERPGGVRGLLRRVVGEVPLNRRLERQVS